MAPKHNDISIAELEKQIDNLKTSSNLTMTVLKDKVLPEDHVSLQEIMAAVIRVTKKHHPYVMREKQIAELVDYFGKSAKAQAIDEYNLAMRFFYNHMAELIDTCEAMADAAEAGSN